MLLALYGIADDDSNRHMVTQLEMQIINPAIDLALKLRVHQPAFYVCIPPRIGEDNCRTTIHDPESNYEKRFLMRLGKEKLYLVDLIVRPAMVKIVEHVKGHKENVVVKCERHSIYAKGPVQSEAS